MRQHEIYEAVSRNIIEQIEAGTPPWRQPWANVGGGIPCNAISQRAYRGINVWLLMATAQRKGYDSPRWATFRQWKQLGGHVNRGEKATKIIYWNIVTETATDPRTGEQEEQQRVFCRQYSVFNLCQCDGTALERFRDPRSFTDYEPAERLLTATGANIRHGGNQAFYRHVADFIQLPEKHRFEGEAHYYSAALHELAHWSGHEGRLNRLSSLSRFGDESYAMEELVAEMASSFLCAALGFENKAAEQQSAAYMAGWLRALQSDRTAIFTASRLAATASDYLLAFNEATQPEEVDPIPF